MVVSLLLVSLLLLLSAALVLTKMPQRPRRSQSSQFFALAVAALLLTSPLVADATDYGLPLPIGPRAPTIVGALAAVRIIDVGLAKPVVALVLRLQDNSTRTVMLAFPLALNNHIYECVDRFSVPASQECNSTDTSQPNVGFPGGTYALTVFPLPVPRNANGIATNWITRLTN